MCKPRIDISIICRARSDFIDIACTHSCVCACMCMCVALCNFMICVQKRHRTIPSPLFPWWCSSTATAIWNPWQPTIRSPSPQFCHVKNSIQVESHGVYPSETDYFHSASLSEIHPSCHMNHWVHLPTEHYLIIDLAKDTWLLSVWDHYEWSCYNKHVYIYFVHARFCQKINFYFIKTENKFCQKISSLIFSWYQGWVQWMTFKKLNVWSPLISCLWHSSVPKGHAFAGLFKF